MTGPIAALAFLMNAVESIRDTPASPAKTKFNEGVLLAIDGLTLYLKGQIVKTEGLLPEEKQLVDNGQWIAAVKSVRQRTGLGLKESKDLVDHYRYKKQ